MIKVILSGYSGKMGHVITDEINSRNDFEIIAGVGSLESDEDPPHYKVFKNIENLSSQGDILIDFSHPSVMPSLLSFCKKNKKPIVICTTGFNEKEILQIKEASEIIPIFFSGNMSLGINLLMNLSKTAAKLLGQSFDIEIIEKHHNQKIDSPSGTALMIANEVSKVLPPETHYIYDRHKSRKKRDKNEIGIHSVRAGNIIGEHEIIFAGTDEIISISHTALSKKIFANGALSAAVFLIKQKPGLYDMSNLV